MVKNTNSKGAFSERLKAELDRRDRAGTPGRTAQTPFKTAALPVPKFKKMIAGLLVTASIVGLGVYKYGASDDPADNSVSQGQSAYPYDMIDEGASLDPDINDIRLEIPLPNYNLSSKYGMRKLNHRINLHEGWDMAAQAGTRIYPAAPGIVVSAKRHGSYGNSIIINHGHGVFTHYAHLSKFDVKKGDHVRTGQVIGRVGNTGRSTGNHLHFEMIILDKDRKPVAINPKHYLGENLADPKTRLDAIRNAREISSKPSGQIIKKLSLN